MWNVPLDKVVRCPQKPPLSVMPDRFTLASRSSVFLRTDCLEVGFLCYSLHTGVSLSKPKSQLTCTYRFIKFTYRFFQSLTPPWNELIVYANPLVPRHHEGRLCGQEPAWAAQGRCSAGFSGMNRLQAAGKLDFRILCWFLFFVSSFSFS